MQWKAKGLAVLQRLVFSIVIICMCRKLYIDHKFGWLSREILPGKLIFVHFLVQECNFIFNIFCGFFFYLLVTVPFSWYLAIPTRSITFMFLMKMCLWICLNDLIWGQCSLFLLLFFLSSKKLYWTAHAEVFHILHRGSHSHFWGKNACTVVKCSLSINMLN